MELGDYEKILSDNKNQIISVDLVKKDIGNTGSRRIILYVRNGKLKQTSEISTGYPPIPKSINKDLLKKRFKRYASGIIKDKFLGDEYIDETIIAFSEAVYNKKLINKPIEEAMQLAKHHTEHRSEFKVDLFPHTMTQHTIVRFIRDDDNENPLSFDYVQVELPVVKGMDFTIEDLDKWLAEKMKILTKFAYKKVHETMKTYGYMEDINNIHITECKRKSDMMLVWYMKVIRE